MLKIHEYLILLAVILASGFAVWEINKPETRASIAVEVPIPADQKVLTAYGFYADMTKDAFNAAVIQLQKDPKSPIVHWYSKESEDGKTIPAIGLIFPAEKFLEVAKKVTAENPEIKLVCEKSEITACTADGSTGDSIVVIDKIFKDKTGRVYGALSIADPSHVDPKNPKVQPEGEKNKNGDLNGYITVNPCKAPQRLLRGKCVTDL